MATEVKKPTDFTEAAGLQWTNEPQAYDTSTAGDETTSADGTLAVDDEDPSITYHTWAAKGQTYTQTLLKMKWSTNDLTGDDEWHAEYTKNGGGAWLDLVAYGTNRNTTIQTAQVTLDANQDLTQVQVRIRLEKQKGGDGDTLYIWDIWTEGEYTAVTTYEIYTNSAARIKGTQNIPLGPSTSNARIKATGLIAGAPTSAARIKAAGKEAPKLFSDARIKGTQKLLPMSAARIFGTQSTSTTSAARITAVVTYELNPTSAARILGTIELNPASAARIFGTQSLTPQSAARILAEYALNPASAARILAARSLTPQSATRIFGTQSTSTTSAAKIVTGAPPTGQKDFSMGESMYSIP